MMAAMAVKRRYVRIMVEPPILFGLAALPALQTSGSAGFPVCLVECLLDVSHSLLHLAYYPLRSAFHLLGSVASQFSKLLLDFACDILGSAFHLIEVHGVFLKCSPCG